MNLKFIIPFLISSCCFLATGCSVSGVHDPKRSDLVEGQRYVMQKPAYVFTHNKEIANSRKRLQALGYARTPSNIDEFVQIMQANPRIAGLLVPGDEIKITRVVTDKSAILGELTDVWALVMTGDAEGMEVEISGISKSKKPSYIVLRDSAYLEPISE